MIDTATLTDCARWESVIINAPAEGMRKPATASTIMAAYCPASRALKYCLPQRQPPRARAVPSTNNALLMIDPVIDALTTEINPWRRAKMPMMISGALPKVAFSKDRKSVVEGKSVD